MFTFLSTDGYPAGRSGLVGHDRKGFRDARVPAAQDRPERPLGIDFTFHD
jgi:hypothetical protein